MNDKKLKLVRDSYFGSGHWGLKSGQTAVAIVGWLGVLFPFFWVLLPVWWPQAGRKLKIVHYQDEIHLLQFLALFFLGYFIFILLFYCGVTLWNNCRFKTTLDKYAVPDQEKLHKREEVIEQAWEKRFGSAPKRHQARFYSVRPDQNLDTHFTYDLFKKYEV
ncbi:cell division protein [Lactobacillus sp. XV13L]|nr:cell division protein [Lactobacillus sp. XV13L]